MTARRDELFILGEEGPGEDLPGFGAEDPGLPEQHEPPARRRFGARPLALLALVAAIAVGLIVSRSGGGNAGTTEPPAPRPAAVPSVSPPPAAELISPYRRRTHRPRSPRPRRRHAARPAHAGPAAGADAEPAAIAAPPPATPAPAPEAAPAPEPEPVGDPPPPAPSHAVDEPSVRPEFGIER